MAKPRKHIISTEVTPYYHCTSRCVRRAFLCGFDAFSGKSYEHRRAWVEDRILFLADVFAVDVCAYAVMSNHHHLVLRINEAKAISLTDEEICERWHQVYKGTTLTQKFQQKLPLTEGERLAVSSKIAQWRRNLCNISWFMKTLNEPIARMANTEDNCTGRFFESRFKCQALVDEKALAACMAYVDLNPMRAKMADKPETSAHTSIMLRTEQLKTSPSQAGPLLPFSGNPGNELPEGLPFRLQEYLELVDWTGRQVRVNKCGALKQTLPPILERLKIEPEQWFLNATQFESRFKSLVGCANQIKKAAALLGLQRTPGYSNCKRAFT